ncbi:hypothetical protein EVAR_40748_1 [Eumeta japonica]|uniref:Histone-lysine N-methyltransferase SETMAR n=1 Tax=Eumeta variegata TaxID=151549 RepID=A0A4C1X5U3_EUMVA|nr:hypothetical protein EVAR_40748_1 [Eumeta japonica]
MTPILATRQMLTEFGWAVLMHPPCSPDPAPSDFHLLRYLQKGVSVRRTEHGSCGSDSRLTLSPSNTATRRGRPRPHTPPPGPTESRVTRGDLYFEAIHRPVDVRVRAQRFKRLSSLERRARWGKVRGGPGGPAVACVTQ